MNHKKLFSGFSMTTVPIFLLIFVFIGFAKQEQERTVDHIEMKDAPIKILRIRIKGTPVEPGAKFAKEEDWLSDMSVTVKNISQKTVRYIEIDIDFLRDVENPHGKDPTYLHSLRYGNEVPLSPDVVTRIEQPSIKPDGTAELILTGDTHQHIRSVLNRINYPATIKRVALMIRTVIFDDGAIWYMGQKFQQDPLNPTKWIHPTAGTKNSGHNKERIVHAIYDVPPFMRTSFLPSYFLTNSLMLPQNSNQCYALDFPESVNCNAPNCKVKQDKTRTDVPL